MRLLATLLLLAVLGGCGQMGPLYMPGEPASADDGSGGRAPDDATND